jgi:hypothetical protein
MNLGLLTAPWSADPDRNASIDQAMWALSAGLLSGAGSGRNFAANLGRAMTGATDAYNVSQQDALRRKMIQSQLDERNAAAEERKRLQDEARRKAETQQAVLGRYSSPQPMGFRDASIAMTGNAPAGYVPPQMGPRQISQADMAQWIGAGLDPKLLEAIATAQDIGRPEVARTLRTADAQGRPQNVQLDRFGRPVGGAMPEPYERKTLDIGGSILDRDPYTGAQLGSIGKTLTPGDIQQAQDAAAGRGVTIRGQNMTDARARENAAATREAAITGRIPSGYRLAADGASLEFIPGGPADPANRNATPTESNNNSFLFANRAVAADAAIGRLFGGEPGARQPSVAGVGIKQNLEGIPLIGPALSSGANLALSDQSQSYEQAKRDFINAVLRKESGAVIGRDEFLNADKQYFPQVGDGKDVIAQKAENRRRAIEGLTVGSGPLAPRVGATDAARAAAQGSQSFSMLPPAREFPNKIATDRVSGKRYRSDGTKWTEVQ